MDKEFDYLYDKYWWRARNAFLADPNNALCVEHKRLGRIVPATTVDHIIPHRGDLKLFWDQNNWQSLCTSCHSKKTNQEVNRRYGYRTYNRLQSGADANGIPLDPRHPWNR